MSIDTYTARILATPPMALARAWNRVEDSAGYLYVDPPATDIARDNKLDLETLSLAALIASEVGTLGPRYMAIVGEVGIAEARARGKSVTALLTSAVKSGHAGAYGEQSGRYAATSRPPNTRHYEAARGILRGETGGFARGARKFFDPKVQDGGKQRGKALANDALGIYEKWFKDGWRWTGHTVADGIDPYILFPMAREGRSYEDGKRAIEEGRRAAGAARTAGAVAVGALPAVLAIGAALAYLGGR